MRPVKVSSMVCDMRSIFFMIHDPVMLAMPAFDLDQCSETPSACSGTFISPCQLQGSCHREDLDGSRVRPSTSRRGRRGCRPAGPRGLPASITWCRARTCSIGGRSFSKVGIRTGGFCFRRARLERFGEYGSLSTLPSPARAFLARFTARRYGSADEKRTRTPTDGLSRRDRCLRGDSRTA
jgi:hypothetical protein